MDVSFNSARSLHWVSPFQPFSLYQRLLFPPTVLGPPTDVLVFRGITRRQPTVICDRPALVARVYTRTCACMECACV